MVMKILVTGAAGFIGAALCERLLNNGEYVIGVDNLNDYYSVSLKKARLARLENNKNFKFYQIDLANKNDVEHLRSKEKQIQVVVHLAAQAGVRYSLENPYSYIDSNIVAHLNILELCRNLDVCKHLVYASSSSVYGANTKLPFSVSDRVDHPISLYAATKKSCELMTHSYSHLFRIPATGLRFFTVYGPWGRPDMAAFMFTKAIFNGDEISVFNHGKMRRNFTYISDIIDGVYACIYKPPIDEKVNSIGIEVSPHAVYNLGNDCSENLMDFISIIEDSVGKKAKINNLPMQPGDVKETIADIEETQKMFAFSPRVNVSEGIPAFVKWYKDFYINI